MPDVHGRRSACLRAAVLFGVAGAVIGLQVALPWYSARLGRYEHNYRVHAENLRLNPTWKQRLRFDRLLNPIPDAGQRLKCLSAAVHSRELIAFLVPDDPKFTVEDASIQVLRFNLETGGVTSLIAPPGIRYVFSDGTRLWWLPGHANSLSPFLWNRLPTSLVSSGVDGTLCRLAQFVDGQWRNTDSFALLPDCFDGEGEPLIRIQTIDDRTLLTYKGRGRIYYRTTLEIGNESEALAYRDQHRSYIKQIGHDEFVAMGWQADDRNINQNQFGYWIEQNQLCSIHATGPKHLQDGSPILVNEFRCDCLRPETKSRTEIVSSPIRWDRRLGATRGLTTMLRVIPTSDHRVYIMSFNRSDGRFVIMRLTDRTLEQVSQTRSPYALMTCIDGVLLLILMIVIPTLLLGGSAWLIQYWRSADDYQFGNAKVHLATTGRRGFARLIDLMIVGSFFLGSIVSHPEFISWWACVVSVDLFGPRLQIWTEMVSWKWFSDRLIALQSMGSAVYAVPFDTRILFLAIFAFASQIVWQGRSGNTIGKWVLGIRTVRTTLRPCGIARSALREILLIVDSLFFVCWIPGVFSILMSRRYQRIGDRLAETIVVRHRRISS